MNNYPNDYQNPPVFKEETLQSKHVEYVYEEEKVSTLMNKVFLWMAAALGLTGLTSYAVAFTPLFYAIAESSILFFGLLIAELVLVLFLSKRVFKMSFFSAALCMGVYSILNGITMSFIFAIYSLGSITTTFFITAGTFTAMALIGYFVKKDLSSWTRYLMMALVGLIIASVVNIFVASSAMDWIVSIIGVVLFTILTAVDTNVIKKQLEVNNGQLDSETMHKIALLGSLNLYLDFVNLFLYLLRFFGSRN